MKAAEPLRRLLRFLLLLLLGLLLLPLPVLVAYRSIDPPITPLMVIRRIQGHGLDRRPVPLERIAPALRRAVIAAEDNRFCEHLGFDLAALRGELSRWWAGERPRGASTITQQTAKNLFLWPGRDPLRKLLEFWLTPQLELLLGKRRILELYLNVAEFGPGVYGAEAAARHWFRKRAAALSEREATALATILPAPLLRDPTRRTPTLDRRIRTLERRVGELGPLLDCAR
jgi:monofunctional biosynthetic peptidoglycan transglycosylase